MDVGRRLTKWKEPIKIKYKDGMQNMGTNGSGDCGRAAVEEVGVLGQGE